MSERPEVVYLTFEMLDWQPASSIKHTIVSHRADALSLSTPPFSCLLTAILYIETHRPTQTPSHPRLSNTKS